MRGFLGEAGETGKTTSATGIVNIEAAIKSGTTVGAAGANQNLLSIKNLSTTRFIFDAEAELHCVGAGGTSVYGENASIADALGVTGLITGLGGITLSNGATDADIVNTIVNSGTNLLFGVSDSIASRFIGSSNNYAFWGTTGADGLEWATNNIVRMAIDVVGAVTMGYDLAVMGDTGLGIAVSASAFGVFGAPTTAKASARLPHGSAPTSPADGDIWTTSAGLFVRIDGSTVGPLS